MTYTMVKKLLFKYLTEQYLNVVKRGYKDCNLDKHILKKFYFTYYNKKVMTYTMRNKTPFTFPTERYLDIIKLGYKNCKLDKRYLIKALKN
jgi:hypothetical protein